MLAFLPAAQAELIITGTLLESAKLSVPAWTNTTQNWALNFSGTPMVNNLAGWDVNTGITMSFNLKFGNDANQSWDSTASYFGFGLGNSSTTDGFDSALLRVGGNGKDPYAGGANNTTIASGSGLSTAAYTYTPYAVNLTITKIATDQYRVDFLNPAGTTISGVLTSAQLGKYENMSINTLAMRQYNSFNWDITANNFGLYTFAIIPEPSPLHCLLGGVAMLLVLCGCRGRGKRSVDCQPTKSLRE